jgi:hypothetical protein
MMPFRPGSPSRLLLKLPHEILEWPAVRKKSSSGHGDAKAEVAPTSRGSGRSSEMRREMMIEEIFSVRNAVFMALAGQT